ncbi:MAG TPA: indolepyruvate oxidoreductase subunit beta [Phycisphaerae bacterium]|nr:indolepyruvate oxidoreductase subunit beta [Phycisphaerae bacterium]
MNATPDRDNGTGWRMLVAGTGGQGVLTAARLLCDWLVDRGHSVVSGQLHGMAQRGGSVQSSVLVDCGISPVMPRGRADYVLGFEPVEAARALPFMSSRTVVYVNTAPVIPYVLAQRSVRDGTEAKYPDPKELADAIRAVTPHLFTFDATERAVEAGSAATLNMIMVGCLLGSGLLPHTADSFWTLVSNKMRQDLMDVNQRAFSSGVELGRRLQ